MWCLCTRHVDVFTGGNLDRRCEQRVEELFISVLKLFAT